MYKIARNIGRGVAFGLSRFGEAIGSDALIYNYGVFLAFHRMAVHNAPHFADVVLGELKETQSIADIGCGSGGYAAEFNRRGIMTKACEYAARGRRWAQRQGVSVVEFDLSKSQSLLPGSPFDVAYSIEVAEHIPVIFADAFVKFMANSARIVLLTAAIPGQGGQGHVNERPRQYWIDKFTAAGLVFREDLTKRISERLRDRPVCRFLYANLMVFQQ